MKTLYRLSSLLILGSLSACSTAPKPENQAPTDFASIKDGEHLFVDRVIAQGLVKAAGTSEELILDAYRALAPARQGLVRSSLQGLKGMEGLEVEAIVKKLKPEEREAFLSEFASKNSWFAKNSKAKSALTQAQKERNLYGNIELNSGVKTYFKPGASDSAKQQLIEMIEHATQRTPGMTDTQFQLQKSITEKTTYVWKKVGVLTKDKYSCVNLSERALKNGEAFSEEDMKIADEVTREFPKDLAKRQACFIEKDTAQFLKNISSKLGVSESAEVFSEARQLIVKCHQNGKELLGFIDQWEKEGKMPDPSQVMCK